VSTFDYDEENWTFGRGADWNKVKNVSVFMLHNIIFYCHICNYFRLYIVKDQLPSACFEFNRGFL